MSTFYEGLTFFNEIYCRRVQFSCSNNEMLTQRNFLILQQLILVNSFHSWFVNKHDIFTFGQKSFESSLISLGSVIELMEQILKKKVSMQAWTNSSLRIIPTLNSHATGFKHDSQQQRRNTHNSY